MSAAAGLFGQLRRMGVPPLRPGEKEKIKRELLSGDYRFSLLSRITLQDGEDTDLWSARDALVLKALAIVLGEHRRQRV
ncbi:MAG: hypothetical protein ACLPTZ_08565 [Beijerinckiaceae bacterium]